MRVLGLACAVLASACLATVLDACSSNAFTGGDGAPNDAQSDMTVADGDALAVGDGADADSFVDASGDGYDGYSQPYRRVFITSGDYSPNLGGLAGADAICSSVASGAGLGGHWAAWLSSSTTSAGSRLEHAAVPYQLLDGTIIASDWSDLISGSLRHPIDRDQHDAVVTVSDLVPLSGYVWTGTYPDGATALPDTCNDWTHADDGGTSSYYAIVGGWPLWDGGATGLYWTQAFAFACLSATAISLYCIEQP